MKEIKKSRSRTIRTWRAIRGGVTAPQGYLASGVAAGIKKSGLDLAILLSARPASAAALFTRNIVQAAPVLLSRKHLKLAGGRIQALLLNSGCANACTGEKGKRDAATCAESVASHLDLECHRVLVGSTGVIGVPLPMGKLLKGISSAVSALSTRGGEAAARAIMTTDTFEKNFAVQGRIAGRTVRIGGMAKGAGMIHPDLATMIVAVTTDAWLPPAALQRILRRVADRTFHSLTVDGDTSTNDMVVVLANGAAEVRVEGRWLAGFEEGLTMVCEQLCRCIARDGEGATKLVEITVLRAPTDQDARRVGKTIAKSALVKTAICGEEPNWGRIACAAGYSGVAFDPDLLSISIGRTLVFRNGIPVPMAKRSARQLLTPSQIEMVVDLGSGKGSAKVWTCDLSREYVDINAGYMS
ncbi:MAG: bifunctional glutamate N-acetyltransferase/amino-acid acetyltransferase ArgJ [Acidobacteria bacterium]|nr:bifunctional glutamate N-acetyltransferase/amino-acid acetyltransferase ArgJ [Acidobacteriota bacterium]